MTTNRIARPTNRSDVNVGDVISALNAGGHRWTVRVVEVHTNTLSGHADVAARPCDDNGRHLGRVNHYWFTEAGRTGR